MSDCTGSYIVDTVAQLQQQYKQQQTLVMSMLSEKEDLKSKLSTFSHIFNDMKAKVTVIEQLQLE